MSLGCCDLQDGNNPGRIRPPNSKAMHKAGADASSIGPLGQRVRGLGSLLYETQENEAKGPAGKVSWHERQTRTINAWTGRNLKERKLSSARGDLTYEGIVGIVVFYQGIGGLVVEYVVAIHVTRVRFPADALFFSSTRQRDMTCNMLQAIVNVKSFE